MTSHGGARAGEAVNIILRVKSQARKSKGLHESSMSRETGPLLQFVGIPLYTSTMWPTWGSLSAIKHLNSTVHLKDNRGRSQAVQIYDIASEGHYDNQNVFNIGEIAIKTGLIMRSSTAYIAANHSARYKLS